MHQNKTEPLLLQGHLDSPAEDQLVDPYTLRIEGWVHSLEKNLLVSEVSFLVEGEVIGSTRHLFPRADVSATCGLSANAKTGFLAVLSAPHLRGKRVVLIVRVRFSNGRSYDLAHRAISFRPVDMVQKPFGHLLDPSHTRILHRADIYGSGPSMEQGSEELIALITRYLGPPPTSILDVGCGLGFYGSRLKELGYDWMGVEPKAEDAKRLAEKGLPFVQGDGHALPFEKGSFDAVICIEVLEHIPEPDRFVAELRRVARQRLIISVPNIEVIPYLDIHAAVPWHMLEGDHKNFFTRHSLRALLKAQFSHVETLMYGLYSLKKSDGGPLHYNLLAIAEV